MPRIWRSSVKRVSPDPGALVPVTWDGRSVTLPEGANLAAALLETGVIVLRATPGKGTPHLSQTRPWMKGVSGQQSAHRPWFVTTGASQPMHCGGKIMFNRLCIPIPNP